MLNPRERQDRLRTAVLAGMTAFVLISLLLMYLTPAGVGAVASRHRWIYIAQISVPCGLLTMALTWFLLPRDSR